MKTSLDRALLALCFALPLAAIGCTGGGSPEAVKLDEVISTAEKADLVSSIYSCKSSCGCASGMLVPVEYDSCSPTNVDAVGDAATACSRACAIMGEPAADSVSTGESCAPTSKACGIVATLHPTSTPDRAAALDRARSLTP